MSARILLIDDEPLVRRTFALALPYEGFEPMTAANGVEALQRIAEGVPALIMLDLHLAGVSGETVLEQLRALPECHDLPVIILSGSDEAEIQSRAQELGAQGWLRKPYTLVELARKIRDQLGSPLPASL